MNTEGRPPKPAWGLLYAILGGIVALWVIAVRATGGSEGDRWLDLFFLAMVYGVVWAWLQANRSALEAGNQRNSRHRPIRIIRVLLFQRLRPMWLHLGNGSPRKGQRGSPALSPDGKQRRL